MSSEWKNCCAIEIFDRCRSRIGRSNMNEILVDVSFNQPKPTQHRRSLPSATQSMLVCNWTAILSKVRPQNIQRQRGNARCAQQARISPLANTFHVCCSCDCLVGEISRIGPEAPHRVVVVWFATRHMCALCVGVSEYHVAVEWTVWRPFRYKSTGIRVEVVTVASDSTKRVWALTNTHRRWNC